MQRKFDKKEKERERLLQVLSKERKENEKLRAKVETEQPGDYETLKQKLFDSEQENDQLKSEIKGLKGKI